MFHFPGFPPPALYIQARVTPHHGCRVPPFGHPRINARLTAPRGLSRPPTSFIGSWYQGIHHAPLNTYTPTTPSHGGGTHACVSRPRTRRHGTHTAFGHAQQTHTTNNHHTNTHTTATHQPRQDRTGRQPGAGSAAVAMLASTIQFTNTHPTPSHQPPRPHHPPLRTPTRERIRTLKHGRRLREPVTGPGPRQHTPPHPTPPQQPSQPTQENRAGGRGCRRVCAGGLFPQDPTVRRPHPRPRTPPAIEDGGETGNVERGRLRCSTNEHAHHPRVRRVVSGA